LGRKFRTKIGCWYFKWPIKPFVFFILKVRSISKGWELASLRVVMSLSCLRRLLGKDGKILTTLRALEYRSLVKMKRVMEKKRRHRGKRRGQSLSRIKQSCYLIAFGLIEVGSLNT
jgi:hypothetical protein